MNDLTFAFRQLLKHPGFTAVAVLTLAGSIGANTAIFSVVNSVLLNPLPYPQPGQLVKIRSQRGDESVPGGGDFVGGHEFNAWREQSQTLAQIAAYGGSDCTLRGRGLPERVRCGTATASLFPLLGVKPAHGRLFTAEEEEPQAAPVAILSHALWERLFAGDPDPGAITLDGKLHTVVGILPPSFRFPDPVEVWVPLQMQPGPEIAGGAVAISLVNTMARLKPGISLAQAQAELQLLASRVTMPAFQGLLNPISEPVAPALPGDDWLETGEPMASPAIEAQNRMPPGDRSARGTPQDFLAPMPEGAPPPPMLFGGGGRIQLVGLHEHLVANVRASLLVLMGAVGFVLLIACANVANLLLTRAISRRREIAIRLALGAPRRRIIRQFLTESTLLAVLGGGLGVLLAQWGVRALAVLTPTGTAPLQSVRIDFSVLAFTGLIALGTGLIFGLAPAWHGARLCVHEALKDGGTGTSPAHTRQRLRGLLVISETALALVLLAGAGLLMSSFIRLRSVDPGFRADGILTFQLNLSSGALTGSAARAGFVRRLREELSALPGVDSVAMTDHLPLTQYSIITAVSVAGEPPEGRAGVPPASLATVTEGYFETLGIAVKQGRALSAEDEVTGSVVVNEQFVRDYFPGKSAVGRRLNRFAGGPGSVEIVGVLADTRQDGFDRDVKPEIYTLRPERELEFFSTAIRFQGDAGTLARAVRERVHALDSSLALYDLMTLRDRLDATIAPRKANLTLLGSFALLALFLAGGGIYGVMSFAVSQRTRELGVRIALGAQPWDVRWLVLGRGLRLVAAGLVVGLAAALVLTRFMASLLYGAAPSDPVTLGAVSMVLLAVGIVACWIPARRATQVDPMVALRSE